MGEDNSTVDKDGSADAIAAVVLIGVVVTSVTLWLSSLT